MQLGRYAEYYAKMEFASYRFDVYTSEVDDHGIDFVAKNTHGKFYEVQVKAIRSSSTNYVFMEKEKFDINMDNLLLMLLIFSNEKLPEAYLIHSKEWMSINSLLTEKDFIGLKSKPEYGLNLSKKNMEILQKYEAEKIISLIK
jgi:hypothetical protein